MHKSPLNHTAFFEVISRGSRVRIWKCVCQSSQSEKGSPPHTHTLLPLYRLATAPDSARCRTLRGEPGDHCPFQVGGPDNTQQVVLAQSVVIFNGHVKVLKYRRPSSEAFALTVRYFFSLYYIKPLLVICTPLRPPITARSFQLSVLRTSIHSGEMYPSVNTLRFFFLSSPGVPAVTSVQPGRERRPRGASAMAASAV